MGLKKSILECVEDCLAKASKLPFCSAPSSGIPSPAHIEEIFTLWFVLLYCLLALDRVAFLEASAEKNGKTSYKTEGGMTQKDAPGLSYLRRIKHFSADSTGNHLSREASTDNSLDNFAQYVTLTCEESLATTELEKVSFSLQQLVTLSKRLQPHDDDGGLMEKQWKEALRNLDMISSCLLHKNRFLFFGKD